MLAVPRHLRHMQLPLNFNSCMLLSMLVCFFPVFLVDGVRPTDHEDAHGVAEIGKVQPLQVATRPGGALVQERVETKLQAKPGGVDDPNGTLDSSENLDLDDSTEAFADGLDTSSGQQLEEDDDLEDDSEHDGVSQSGELAENVGMMGEQPTVNGSETELQASANELGESDPSLQSESASRDSGEKRPLHAASKRLTQDFSFTEAPAKIDAMSNEVEKMRERRKSVVEAYQKTDEQMTGYEESIQKLSDQFRKLKNEAHGIHNSVLNEYGRDGDKEARRMSAFAKAERVLHDEAELPSIMSEQP